MSLSTVAQEDAVKLNWTAYNGWQMIDHYEIFRGDAHTYSISAMDSIGAVSATELTFIDTTTFCSDSVFYRIVAIESGGGQQISYSDVSGNAPKHNPPTEKMNIIFASVPDDKVVDISWEPYAGYKPVNYVLERSLGGQVWKELAQLPLGQTTYTDTDVMVDSLSYIYRVYAIDSCGDRSPVGLIGKTILLKASIFMDGYEVPRLDWTKYEKWPSNVEYYEIQVFDELNDWKRVDIVGPNVNTYKDYKTTLYQSTYCYRIIAKEVGGHFATSISNESCVTFLPKLWAPNAFTPNNDGKNDIFLLRGPNIESFEMTIFDRWGKIIFVSRSIDDGWDGTIEGQDAPEGAYVFKVNAVGYKGEPFKLNGSVTLVR
jgi:gliding motility-associated-like protein